MSRSSSLVLVPILLLMLAPWARGEGRAGQVPAVLPAARPLDVSGVDALDARPPRDAGRPVFFRHGGRRGWIARLPAPRKRPPTTPGWPVATVPSPAVWKGLVYAGVGFDGWALHALSARTGMPRWTVDFKDNGPTTPTITPRRLYCNTESCTTYAITPRHGRVTWSRTVGPSVMAAAAADDHAVYAAHRTESGEYLLTAMAEKDGGVLWQRPLTQDIHGRPMLANGRIYLACRDGVVCCFERDGTPRWFARAEAGSAPWVTPDGVYLAESVVHRKGPPALQRLDADTGRRVWRTDTELRMIDGRLDVERERRHGPEKRILSQYAADGPRPVVLGDLCLLAAARDLIAFDAGSGAVRWIKRLPQERRFHAPPAVLGDRLLYATFDGLLLEIDARRGSLRKGLDLRVIVSSQPVVAEGRVHVTAGELVYGIPWDEPGGFAWPQWGGLGEPGPAPEVTPSR